MVWCGVQTTIKIEQLVGTRRGLGLGLGLGLGAGAGAGGVLPPASAATTISSAGLSGVEEVALTDRSSAPLTLHSHSSIAAVAPAPLPPAPGSATSGLHSVRHAGPASPQVFTLDRTRSTGSRASHHKRAPSSQSRHGASSSHARRKTAPQPLPQLPGLHAQPHAALDPIASIGGGALHDAVAHAGAGGGSGEPEQPLQYPISLEPTDGSMMALDGPPLGSLA